MILVTRPVVFFKMGGVKKFDYPKYVWSPTGGWWCNPRNWRRNTAIAFVALFAVSVPIAYKGLELELLYHIFDVRPSEFDVYYLLMCISRRPVAPYRHIPSQKLAKHAKDDDPSVPDTYRILKWK